MMLNEANDVVFLGELDKIQVVAQQLHSGLGDEDVNTVFHCKFSNWIMCVY